MPEMIQETFGGLVVIRGPLVEIAPPTPQEAAQMEIERLEREFQMPRITREALIALAEERALAAGYTLAQLLAKNKGYAGLKALDDQIAALRAQL